ncbi:MAG: sigma-70 family RNA polymerase sigma factor [Puia sp.]
MADTLNIDQPYWARLRNGDADALGYLYEKHVDKLFVAAIRLTDNRELAKDALQEVFIQLWNYRKNLAEVSHSQGYMVKVLRNTLLKKIKKEQATARLVLAESMVCPENNKEDLLIRMDSDQENRKRLTDAMSSLSSRQALILKLHFYEGLSYEQIAERLSMNYQSVNNLAFRTIMRLRSQICALLILTCNLIF